MAFYQYHVFFCTNLRKSGAQCCGQGQADELREYAKKQLKKQGLHRAGKIRVNQASCFDRCALGPVLVIYPQGIWYHYQNQQDIDEIIEQHLKQGKIVQRLLLSDIPPNSNVS